MNSVSMQIEFISKNQGFSALIINIQLKAISHTSGFSHVSLNKLIHKKNEKTKTLFIKLFGFYGAF